MSETASSAGTASRGPTARFETLRPGSGARFRVRAIASCRGIATEPPPYRSERLRLLRNTGGHERRPPIRGAHSTHGVGAAPTELVQNCTRSPWMPTTGARALCGSTRRLAYRDARRWRAKAATIRWIRTPGPEAVGDRRGAPIEPARGWVDEADARVDTTCSSVLMIVAS